MAVDAKTDDDDDDDGGGDVNVGVRVYTREMCNILYRKAWVLCADALSSSAYCVQYCSSHQKRSFHYQMHQMSFHGLAPPSSAGEALLAPLTVAGKEMGMRKGREREREGMRGREGEGKLPLNKHYKRNPILAHILYYYYQLLQPLQTDVLSYEGDGSLVLLLLATTITTDRCPEL